MAQVEPWDNHPDDEGNYVPEPAPATEGWAWPANSRKAHYFVDGRSLCGKWGWVAQAGLDDTPYSGPDDCRTCAQELNKRRRKAGLFRIKVVP